MSDERGRGLVCSSLKSLGLLPPSCAHSLSLLLCSLDRALVQAELKKKVETAEKLEGEKGKVSEVKKGEAPPPGKELPYSPVNAKQ
jgi:hypothetical protein